MRPVLAVWILVVLFLATIAPHPSYVAKVFGTGSAVDFVINAYFSGWNATTNPNPTITEYRSHPFNVLAKPGDVFTHDFAIYARGTPPSSVRVLDRDLGMCKTSNTTGCLAATANIPPARTLLFTPGLPADDGTGPGGYEYYCQFHPFSMHGKFTILKNPDINGDGAVNFLDLGTVGAAFLSSPGGANWNVAADINNDFAVNFLDLGTIGSLFLKTI